MWREMDDTFNFDILDNFFSDLIMDGKIIVKDILNVINLICDIMLIFY